MSGQNTGTLKVQGQKGNLNLKDLLKFSSNRSPLSQGKMSKRMAGGGSSSASSSKRQSVEPQAVAITSKFTYSLLEKDYEQVTVEGVPEGFERTMMAFSTSLPP